MTAPEQEVKAPSAHVLAIAIEELHTVTKRTQPIPFSVYEAEAATDFHSLTYRVRLSNRIMDLRTQISKAIFRLQSVLCPLFRSFLNSQNFPVLLRSINVYNTPFCSTPTR